jgi:hypothetical protein
MLDRCIAQTAIVIVLANTCFLKMMKRDGLVIVALYHLRPRLRFLCGECIRRALSCSVISVEESASGVLCPPL